MDHIFWELFLIFKQVSNLIWPTMNSGALPTAMAAMLEQGCFTSHLLSFDNNKVSKIINWIC